MEKRKKDL
jgi:hypothetical protein